MNVHYEEGAVFALPLREGGFGIGVVARTSPLGDVMLCYFFGPRLMDVPATGDWEELDPRSAVLAVRVGDLYLTKGRWPIVGRIKLWQRAEWPMPAFLRRAIGAELAWSVHYSDTDPLKLEREEPEPFDSALSSDFLYGAGAAEAVLTKVLQKPCS